MHPNLIDSNKMKHIGSIYGIYVKLQRRESQSSARRMGPEV